MRAGSLERPIVSDFRRLFRTLAFANFLLYFGFNVWRAVFNNFAVDELGVGAEQMGLIQSVRELPGLMGFVLGLLALVLSEMRLMGLSVLLLGLGLVVCGGSDTLSVLMVGALLMSVGFHFFYPSNSSVVLMAAGKEEAPKTLGRLRSVSSFAAVVGTLVVWVFVEGVEFGTVGIPAWGYRTVLYVVGGVVIAGSLLALRNGRHKGRQNQGRKVVFRREYWLYYALTFMMGCRRHIFTTFAIFLLVQVYGIGVRETATLFLVNHMISTYAGAQLGRLVARFGERKVLTANFVGLAFVFLGYAFVPFLPILFALFVLDHVFFGFNLAVESFFQKIARAPEEITSNVSMAQTINHVSALIVPVLGGILWVRIAPSATFLAGVAITLVSLVLVQFIGPKPVTASVAVPLD
jgi:MFS family permease